MRRFSLFRPPRFSSAVYTATVLFPYRGTTTPEVSIALDGSSAVIQTAGTGELRVECALR